FLDANHLTVTFDLTGLPVGSYTLRVDDGPQTATAPTPFQVTGPAPEAAVVLTLVVPSQVRVGSPMSAAVTITNYGTNDVLLPTFHAGAGGPGPPVVTSDPGLLPAGPGVGPDGGEFSSVRFGATFLPRPSHAHLVHGFNLTTFPSTATIDWAEAEAPSRPPT